MFSALASSKNIKKNAAGSLSLFFYRWIDSTSDGILIPQDTNRFIGYDK
jgi:hypothetical protein